MILVYDKDSDKPLFEAEELSMKYSPETSDVPTDKHIMNFNKTFEGKIEYKDVRFDDNYLTAMVTSINEMSAETLCLYAYSFVEMIMTGQDVRYVTRKVSINDKIPYRTFVPVCKIEERERLLKEGRVIDVMDFIKINYAKAD